MFTGLVEEIGRMQRMQSYGQGSRLTIAAEEIVKGLQLGDSVAINGVCLTVVQFDDRTFSVEAVQETLQRTTLANLRANDAVNLERALLATSRLGGHFVQGHVDGIAEIVAISTRDPGFWLQIRLAEPLLPLVVQKGSIAVDGVSLTIAEIENDRIAIALIPHSAQMTTLASKKNGDLVNIECDIIAKYVGRLLGFTSQHPSLSQDTLKQWGY